MRTHIAAASLTACLLGGGAVGALLFSPALAGAQDAADERGRAEQRSGRGWVRDALDSLVEDEMITAEQADGVATALAEARPAHGFGGRHGFGALGLDAAAEAIGTTREELGEELAGGSTLAEVAAANGVEREALLGALTAAVQAELDERVDAGALTEGRAAELMAAASERSADLVDRERPLHRPHGGRHGHGLRGDGEGG